MQNSNRCITMKTKIYLEFKNTPKGRAVMRARNGKLCVSQAGSFLEDSGIQVKFLSLGSEELELIPARTLP